MLLKCAENIRKGISPMIFPEGTRSRNGELRTFKGGAFMIALQEKIDIVPFVLDDSYKALPEKGIMPRRKQHIRLHILPPVLYESFKEMDTRQLSTHIHALMAAELSKMRE